MFPIFDLYVPHGIRRLTIDTSSINGIHITLSKPKSQDLLTELPWTRQGQMDASTAHVNQAVPGSLPRAIKIAASGYRCRGRKFSPTWCSEPLPGGTETPRRVDSRHGFEQWGMVSCRSYRYRQFVWFQEVSVNHETLGDFRNFLPQRRRSGRPPQEMYCYPVEVTAEKNVPTLVCYFWRGEEGVATLIPARYHRSRRGQVGSIEH